MSKRRSAIVLSIDGLSARYLGPYGNTWLQTPGFNRVSSHSILYETSMTRIAGSQNPDDWGWARRLSPQAGANRSIFEGDWKSTLVTDASHVANWGEDRFDDIVDISSEAAHQSAGEVAETAMARYFSQAIEWAARISPGELLILHSAGFYLPWDAPMELRESLRGDDDPPPPIETVFPNLIDREIDPDILLGWQQAYGAQLSVLDQCVELLWESITENFEPTCRPLFCLTSPRAFPLGEHGLFGNSGGCLFDDNLHVPLMIANPTAPITPSRALQLVYSDHWVDSVNDWMLEKTLIAPPVLPSRQTEFLISHTTTEPAELAFSIRTHAWKLIHSPSRPNQLYAKPDDRWEKNDVADRCREVVEQLEKLGENANCSDASVELSSLLSRGAG